jgi:hypothetical protein
MTDVTMKVRASEIRPGDFLRSVEASTVYGPRGGKYRWDGVRVDSRVVSAGWRDPNDHRRGFRVVPSTGPAFGISRPRFGWTAPSRRWVSSDGWADVTRSSGPRSRRTFRFAAAAFQGRGATSSVATVIGPPPRPRRETCEASPRPAPASNAAFAAAGVDAS